MGFLKRGDKWRLFISNWHEEAGDPTLVPIASARREQRVLAAHRLPALLDKMRADVVRETERVNEAKTAIVVFLASLDSEELGS